MKSPGILSRIIFNYEMSTRRCKERGLLSKGNMGNLFVKVESFFPGTKGCQNIDNRHNKSILLVWIYHPFVPLLQCVLNIFNFDFQGFTNYCHIKWSRQHFNWRYVRYCFESIWQVCNT